MNYNQNRNTDKHRVRNLNLVRFVVIPGCFVLLVAAIIFFSVFPSPAVPTTAQQDTGTETVLTHFSDDLGEPSTLEFTTTQVKKDALSKGSLVLVNSKTVWNFPETKSLVSVYDYAVSAYQLSGTGVQLQKEAIEPLNEMMQSFQKITGFGQVMISEGYRSQETQDAVYKQALNTYGETSAKEHVAQPGYSEYHTGYALTFSLYENGTVMDFLGTDDCEWLLRNCYRYGFILRYPEEKSDITGYAYQPWHFRYVGQPHAYLMNLKNYCLEEYLEYVSHYVFGGNHIHITDNENQEYEIYYVPMEGETTEVPIPMDREYTISGDNHNGFIVTVKL